MDISLLKVLLDSISSFLSLSSLESLDSEPIRRYYRKIEEILKLLKPVLDVTVNLEVASDELLKKESEELSQLVDELRELFENWHPLMSKVYFILLIESLISKMRTSGLEILLLLKSYHQSLPAELSSTSLEPCIQKFQLMGHEETSNILKGAIREEAECIEPSSDNLIKIADSLNLILNQEVLIEAVALEKLKEMAEQAENNEEAEYIDKMIALVTRMHDRLIMIKQSQSCSPIPIPSDFCCPLSLEVMTDPVIVASGQTYERAYIKEWIDIGLTVCPKTRQPLSQTDLVPNYNVKALIANWCELNNVKLPDPVRVTGGLNQPSPLLCTVESGASRDPKILHPRSNRSMPPEPMQSVSVSSGTLQDQMSPSHRLSSSEGSLSAVVGNGHALDTERRSVSSSEEMAADSEERGMDSGRQPTQSPSRNEISPSGADAESFQSHKRTSSASSTLPNGHHLQGTVGDTNEISQMSTNPTTYRSDASGDAMSEPRVASPLTPQRREPEYPRRLEMRSRSQSIWRRPTERFVPRIVSSPAIETRADLSGIEIHVRKLVEDLKSPSVDTQREATAELRLLAKHNMDNRIVIANCGALNLLVNLLLSPDPETQENAVTALLNLSINDNNKTAIANAGAIEPLIHVLETGTPEAKENSAATLFSLSVIEDNKIMIGRSGAIRPLVDLLGNGTPRGKKDAATALFNLSIFHENKSKILEAGAVKHLVELMDPAAGMVDKAVAVLANLATTQEGRIEIGQEGGIPVLVEVVELGSGRGKENAAAALLQLCTHNGRFCNMVLQEGAVPPLVALSQSGTPRAKEKAQALLNCFRNQRHGNSGRG